MGFMKIHLHIIKRRGYFVQAAKMGLDEDGGKKRQMEELVIKQQCFIVCQPIHLI